MRIIYNVHDRSIITKFEDDFVEKSRGSLKGALPILLPLFCISAENTFAGQPI